MGQEFLKNAIEIILRNLNNPRFDVTQLAQELGTSRSVLLRKLKALTGKSATRLIREIRLQRARELMEMEGLTAAEASYRTGFSSPAYFSNCFHEHFGFPPGEVKKKANHLTVANTQPASADMLASQMVSVNSGTKSPDHKLRVRRTTIAGSSVILLAIAVIMAILLSSNFSRVRSIAVLPFVNLTNDTTQQWLCEGFKQDLLNNLARLSSFSVVSSISSDQYRNTKKSAKTIGKELHANYLITGTIGREGHNLKICVQVIKSKTDRQVWSSDTIRNIEKDWFIIQRDLTRAIASELNATLSSKEDKNIEQQPTKSLEAYDSFLQGNFYITDFKDSKLAIKHFEKAIERDSGFALAYARLAYCLAAEYFFFWDRGDQVLPRCKKSIDKAFELDPDLPEAHLALGYYYYWGFLRYADAIRQAEIILQEQPNNASALALAGYANRRSGHYELAKTYLVRAFQLNPRSYQLAYDVGGTFDALRDYPGAQEYYEKGRLILPDAWTVYSSWANLIIKWKGDTQMARKILDDASKNVKNIQSEPDFLLLQSNLNLIEGNYSEALKSLLLIKSEAFDGQYSYRPKYTFLAKIYGLMKQPILEGAYYDSARALLEKRIREFPADPRLYSSLGIAYAGLHLEDKAIEAGQKAIQMLPVEKETLSGTIFIQDLAIIYSMVGKYPEAIQQLKKVLSIPGFLSVKSVQLESRFAPLRDLPEFRKMIKEFEVR